MSLGPRIARVHVGGGRTAVSTGRGPLTAWTTLSGGGHTAPPPAVSRRQAKEDEWASTRRHLDALLSAHQQPVTRSTRPVVPEPPPLPRAAVRRELTVEATAELRAWQLGARVAARRDVADRLDAEVAAQNDMVVRQHAEQQAAADTWWQALLANDPEVVTGHLDRSLADHRLPAAVAAVADGRAHLVIAVSEPEVLIGRREPTLTEKGNLSLKRMTRTRQHELYEAAISSAILAVAAEAFAVAPALAMVDIAVVAPDHVGGAAVLALVELPRDTVLPDAADRPVVSDLRTAAEARRASLVSDKGGRVGALRPLDPEDPDVAMLLDLLDRD